MKNLGKKITTGDMYPSMAGEDKNKIMYPHVTLPLSLIDGEADLNEEITMVLKGKITRVEKSEYAEEFTVELTKGEVSDTEKETSETLLG